MRKLNRVGLISFVIVSTVSNVKFILFLKIKDREFYLGTLKISNLYILSNIR